MYSISINAEANVIKTVGRTNKSAGYVYVPKEWVGRKAMVVLLPEGEE